MATYSTNTTIKVSAKISATAFVGGINPTLSVVYTVPANSYAIVNLRHTGTAGTGVQFEIGSGGFFSFLNSTSPQTAFSIYLGPAETLTFRTLTGDSSNCYVNGVVFTNTP